MDKYTVRLYARAYRDLEGIYSYLAQICSEPLAANHLLDALEEAICSLEILPERGSLRRVGVYAGGDYRQLLVKNYAVIYRVQKDKKEVYIVTVRYAPSNF